MAKTGAQSFVQSWAKTQQWATSQGIPASAIRPVYQMDAQKLMTGYPMSEAERVRAIQASAGLNYSSALPTDAPHPTDVLSNVVANTAKVGVGLDPVNIVKNIFDTVTNTIAHPSSVYGAFLTKSAGFNLHELDANLQKYVLAPHSLLSWVPGLADIAQATEGKRGVENLATNPVSSLLDLIGIGHMGLSATDKVGLTKDMGGQSLVGRAVAASPKGQFLAEKLGVTTDELSKMPGSKVSFRILKLAKMPGDHPNIIKDAAGQTVDVRPMTIGERINAFRNTYGIGSSQADLIMGAVMKSEEGTKKVQEMAGPAVEAIGKLTPEENAQLLKTVMTDHRPQADIQADSRLTPATREAIAKVYDYNNTSLQMQMQMGTMVSVDNTVLDANGNEVTVKEYYTVRPDSSGPVVVRANNQSLDAQAILDKASKPLDALIYKVQAMDSKMAGAFTVMEQNVAALYDTIKKSIPELADDAQAQRLRTTLPSDQRWDRAVPEQTPLLKNLLGLKSDERLTLHHVNVIRDLFQPGGLLDTMTKSYNDQDWVALSKSSKVAARKFANQSFSQIPKDGAAILYKMQRLTDNIHSYAVTRERDTNAMDRLMTGTRHGVPVTSKKARSESIQELSRRAAAAHQKAIKTAIEHPPDVWRNTYLDLYTNQILNNEHSAQLIDDATASLKKQGWEDTELDKIRQDPRTIIEILSRSAKNTYENNMMPDIALGDARTFSKDAYNELSSLRARGHAPMYVPSVSPLDVKDGRTPTYNVQVGALKPKSVSATHDRIFDYTPSIYDIQLGILKGTKDMIQHDLIQEFIDTYVTPHLHDTADTISIVRNYINEEIAHNALKAMEGVRTDPVDALIQQQLDRMGLISYDPASIFGPLSSTAQLSKPYLIDKNLASALEQTVRKFQTPGEHLYQRATKVFRTSILALSPRYTAHILFGGTYLLALRGHASMLTQLGEMAHVFKSGSFSDDVLKSNPHANDIFTNASTQEGTEDIVWHRAAGKQMGNLTIQEFLDKHALPRTALNWTKAAGNLNYRFTRAITRAQRAVTYLDGAARAEKEGHFYESSAQPVTDEHGNPVINPATGRQVYKTVRNKVTMTKEQAHQEGMHAVAEVMGDLRRMTPLERSVLTTAFPFYGWTKHILSYVLTYPADHPYRAMFLSQLAEQNSDQVASGLPTRIQLLFFLGQPDSNGNVSAIDTRTLDPFRDISNYGTSAGIFQSLNPVITAAVAHVDPQITYGGNSLYPNVTYNSLYGINEAGPQGTGWSTAEQFIPQLSALDEAFNLSGQYAYLKTTNASAFAKKVATAVGIPFYTPPVNPQQIAAKDEIDRYNDAKAIAQAALETGDFSQVDQIQGTVPDPLNPAYNVTAEYLKALYAGTAGTGVSPLSAYRDPKTPAL